MEVGRSPGDLHCAPLQPCKRCGQGVDIVEHVECCYTAECRGCGYEFGYPYGYSSRLDLAFDWNSHEPGEQPRQEPS